MEHLTKKKKVHIEPEDEQRHFSNPYLQQEDEGNSFFGRIFPLNKGYDKTVSDEEIKEQLFTFLSQVDDAASHSKQSFSIYTGIGGIAFTHFRLYQIEKEEKHLDKALVYAQKSFELSKQSRRGTEVSFLEGGAGPLALLAVLFKLKKEERKSAKYVEVLKSMASEVVLSIYDSNELLYGRVGYLYALLFVQKHLGEDFTEEIMSVVQVILKEGRENKLGFDSPLMYSWHGKTYLAAAHGVSGILYVLLDAPAVRKDQKAMKDIEGTADYLVTLRFPSGNYPTRADGFIDELVQWCHGAPALGLFFCKAYEVFKKDVYLKEAMSCAEVVWRRGLLKKGVGLCHGISGNGYLFLKLFNITKEKKHMWRAKKFAEFILSEQGRSTYKQPDHAASLMEGMSGAICYFLDLLHPPTATFPAYDL